MMELQPIQEQDVYTVNYGTQNLLSSGGKATKYMLGLCVHYLVLECSYLLSNVMKWNIGKKGGATFFFARSEGGATEFFAKFEGGPLAFSRKIWQNPPAPPTHI